MFLLAIHFIKILWGLTPMPSFSFILSLLYFKGATALLVLFIISLEMFIFSLWGLTPIVLRPSGDFGISVLNSYPCYLAVYAWPATLPRQTQDSLQILWLAAYLMGLPPTGLYTLCWTHGLTPMCISVLEPETLIFSAFLFS